jgi:hypothetical protein
MSDNWQHARHCTGDLRNSTDPTIVHLRTLLQERGVDPQTAILADFFYDGGGWCGALVTANRRVISFWLSEGVSAADDVIYDEDWQDRTDASPETRNHLIAAAIGLLDELQNGQ